jgi:hypothetical protein
MSIYGHFLRDESSDAAQMFDLVGKWRGRRGKLCEMLIQLRASRVERLQIRNFTREQEAALARFGVF